MNDAPPEPSAVSRRVTIVNKRGLHARAAARFVKQAALFKSRVEVTKKDVTVSGSSIMGLMMLAAATGCEIDVSARGQDAAAAIESLAALVAAGFDED